MAAFTHIDVSDGEIVSVKEVNYAKPDFPLADVTDLIDTLNAIGAGRDDKLCIQQTKDNVLLFLESPERLHSIGVNSDHNKALSELIIAISDMDFDNL